MSFSVIKKNKIDFVPARHEDQSHPAILKKVLLSSDELLEGSVKMINFCKIIGTKPSSAHYHESLQEIFIVLSGKIKIKINKEEVFLEEGDTIVVNPKDVHQMWNLAKKDSEFIAIGIAKEDGKTIIV